MSYRYKGKKNPDEDQRDFDTTSLREGGAGRTIHRDYAAHFFRWGFTRRFIHQGMRVLDVGCGPDQALARILTRQVQSVPEILVGVDYAPVKVRWNNKWFKLYSGFDFTKHWRKIQKADGPFDVVCCFEVIEHMQVKHGRNLLKGLLGCLKKDGRVLLSTPCYDGRRMAHNHIHEYTIPELQKAILKAGFKIEARYGTFMDLSQLKKATVMKDPAHRQVFDQLKAYYENDVLSCFLAPLYPDHARNNLWVLRRA